ncbi:MAG: alpha/beta hydrolase, partial [Proteobacteria bacterium]|nr:alpha/beta hydrolase [Pseudomonadota bacterium]
MNNSAEITVQKIIWRFLGRIALALIALYLSFCTYLYFDQRHLIYFPEYARTTADTNYSLRNGNAMLHGWVLNPAKTAALLYFGGNGEDLGAERFTLAKIFADRSLFLLPYRGYGPNAGSPTESAIFSDALALYDGVRADHSRIAVVGRSLGSGVASYLAFRRP